MSMAGIRRAASVLTVVGLAACAAAWAQQKRAEEDVEGRIRQTGFHYFFGTIFGDADEYQKATRMPLWVVKDGGFTAQDARSLLADLAKRNKALNLSAEDRKTIATNMLAIFDEASVQFIGADTATITFLIRPGKKDEGDRLGMLVEHREGGEWKVIAEITDSAPVPPSYLAEVPKPK